MANYDATIYRGIEIKANGQTVKDGVVLNYWFSFKGISYFFASLKEAVMKIDSLKGGTPHKFP